MSSNIYNAVSHLLKNTNNKAYNHKLILISKKQK